MSEKLEDLRRGIRQMERVLNNTENNIETNPPLNRAIDELNNGYDYIESLREAGADLIAYIRGFDPSVGGEHDEAYTIKDIFNALCSLKQNGADLEQGGVTIAELAERLRAVAV